MLILFILKIAHLPGVEGVSKDVIPCMASFAILGISEFIEGSEDEVAGAVSKF